MEMVLIRAPPSGLIIKAVCISLHLRKPQMPWHSEPTHTHVRLLNLAIFCVGRDLVTPSLEGVNSYPSFFPFFDLSV